MGHARSTRHFFSAAASQARTLGRVVIDGIERRRTHQTAIVVVTALFIGTFTSRGVMRVRNLEHRWTSQTSVLVTYGVIRAGELISPANTRTIPLPVAVTAADALRSIAPGSRARISLADRTPLTASMVAVGSSRIAVPSGWRGVAMPADLIAPRVTAGDKVDVVAAGAIVAADALVISVGPERQITIAVPIAAAATVATAARLGEVSLIVSS